MSKQRGRGPLPPKAIGTLPERAAEALRHGKFKEAIDLFKMLIRQDPKPEWKTGLADSYAGRARDLAAKKMFKEAAMVLENTLAPDGTLREPRLYVTCLIRDGQIPKATRHLLLCVGLPDALPAEERAELEDLAAAMLLASAPSQKPAGAAPPDPPRWRETAAASRAALGAWSDGAPAEEVERQLNAISLRSAFRPIRLLLKTLVAPPHDAERTRQVLAAIAEGSPFFPLRQAVEAVVLDADTLEADSWNRLSPAQQIFLAEAMGLAEASTRYLTGYADAARRGPAAVFAWLLKQPDLPRDDVRSACLNLLPKIPDQTQRFETTFGPLTPLERHRVKALAAEARGDWKRAEQSWQSAINALDAAGDDRLSRLSQAVIFRHLAHLAATERGLSGGYRDDPAIHYLEHAEEVDPDHIPTVLDLITAYRKADREEDGHRLADEAVQRFPEESPVLLAAMDSAVARKSFQRAAGFARTLLKFDPINAGVRRRMIELQVAHAGAQMRAQRPDLATSELADAAEWERADAPSAKLRVARALVAMHTAPDPRAEAWLREGVSLAGGGVAGWFLACLDSQFMTCADAVVDRTRLELARAALAAPPDKAAVMAVIAAANQPDADEHKQPVVDTLASLRSWLADGAELDWTAAEFQTLAETLTELEEFDLLGDYARAGRARDPENSVWRFHEIVARTQGDAGVASEDDFDALTAIADDAGRRQDFHMMNRVERFMYEDGAPPADLEDMVDEGEFQEMIEAMIDEMPRKNAAGLRELVGEVGQREAVSHMVEYFATAADAPPVPAPLLRQLCEMMVAKAMNSSGRPKSHGTKTVETARARHA